MRFGLVIVTVAPGRGLLSSSITVPVIAPVSLDWEKAAGERIKMTVKTMIHDLVFILLYLQFVGT